MENLIVMTNVLFDNSLHNDQINDGKLRVNASVSDVSAQIGGGVKIEYNMLIWQKDLVS